MWGRVTGWCQTQGGPHGARRGRAVPGGTLCTTPQQGRAVVRERKGGGKMGMTFLGDFSISPQGRPKVLSDTAFLRTARGKEVLSGMITCAPYPIWLPQPPRQKHKHLHLPHIICCPSQDCSPRLHWISIVKILHSQNKIFPYAE